MFFVLRATERPILQAPTCKMM